MMTGHWGQMILQLSSILIDSLWSMNLRNITWYFDWTLRHYVWRTRAFMMKLWKPKLSLTLNEHEGFLTKRESDGNHYSLRILLWMNILREWLGNAYYVLQLLFNEATKLVISWRDHNSREWTTWKHVHGKTENWFDSMLGGGVNILINTISI